MTNPSLFAEGPAVVAFIAVCFATACFQLGVSVLTLISSHTIGAGRSARRLIGLLLGYLFGVLVAFFVLTMLALKLVQTWQLAANQTAWLALSILCIVLGVLVVAFYYRHSRHDKGTSLWVPRPLVRFLSTRTKRTRSAIETTSLGIVTVAAELPFSFACLLVAAFLFAPAEGQTGLLLGLIFAVAVCLPLFFTAAVITSGHKISTVQRWRENNKNFLKWASGVCLILLGLYLITWRGVLS